MLFTKIVFKNTGIIICDFYKRLEVKYEYQVCIKL